MNTAHRMLPLNVTPPAGPRFGRYVAAAALAVAALLGVGAPALAVPPSDVVVEDTADILDQGSLVRAIEDTGFREPTTVVVFTERGDPDDHFNEQILAYARDQHPEWLSDDGQKWADGLFIVGLDPEGRHIGTYFGEDRKVSLDDQTDIQDSAKELLAQAQWTDGAIEVVHSGARIINRPWYLGPVALVLAGIGVLTGGAVAVALLVERRNNRRAFARAVARGDDAYTNVTMDLQATELNARTIPVDSTYGSLVLDRYREFRSRFTQLNDQRREVDEIPAKGRSTAEGVARAEAYAEAAIALDKLDDVIADANVFLNHSAGWEQAWERQARDLREDLNGIDEVLEESESSSSAPSAVPLLSFREETRSALDSWGADLAAGSMLPDAALDALRDARARLSELLRSHAESVISADATSEAEADLMLEELEQAHTESTRPQSRRSSILTAAYPGVYYWSAASIHTGYSAGQSAVASARSSSSSGYGASGGSFSGAGSSSSF